jgi:hypothetical protein
VDVYQFSDADWYCDGDEYRHRYIEFDTDDDGDSAADGYFYLDRDSD